MRSSKRRLVPGVILFELRKSRRGIFSLGFIIFIPEMWQLDQDYTLLKIVKYSSGIKLDWGLMVLLWSRVVMRFPPNDRKINQRDDEQKKRKYTMKCLRSRSWFVFQASESLIKKQSEERKKTATRSRPVDICNPSGWFTGDSVQVYKIRKLGFRKNGGKTSTSLGSLSSCILIYKRI